MKCILMFLINHMYDKWGSLNSYLLSYINKCGLIFNHVRSCPLRCMYMVGLFWQEGGGGASRHACGGAEAEHTGPTTTGGLPDDHHRQVRRGHRQIPQHPAQRAPTGGGHQAGDFRGRQQRSSVEENQVKTWCWDLVLFMWSGRLISSLSVVGPAVSGDL